MSAEIIPIAPARRLREAREVDKRRRDWEAANLGSNPPRSPRPAA